MVTVVVIMSHKLLLPSYNLFLLGGNVFMTCNNGPENREYKAALEHELKKMEEEGLWCRVAVIVRENWIKSMSAEGESLSASVYVYKKV